MNPINSNFFIYPSSSLDAERQDLEHGLTTWVNKSEAKGNKAEAKQRILSAYDSKATELNLVNLELSALPPQIGALSSLTSLNLSFNQLASLPEEIGALSSLTSLNLSCNKLASLPEAICTLSNLQELVLSGNQRISLPQQIGDLLHLKTLDLSSNQLDSLAPQIGTLSSLETLNLSFNQLTSLPQQIGALTSLQELVLSGNQLTSLPTEICALSSLETLDLSDNMLASLPPEICTLSSLQGLVLSGNQLTSLPTEIGALSSLKELNLRSNRLTFLPQEIGALSNLQGLDLSSNQLDSLAPQIGALTGLEILDLSGNQLDSLAPQIGALTGLEILDLSGNQLISLPQQIGDLLHLKTLDLSSNQLDSLAPQIGTLSSLETLILSDNQLDSLPPQIGALTGLEILNLSGNQLISLPQQIGDLLHLKTLVLSGNQLTSLPNQLGLLFNLSRFLLSNNQELRDLPLSLAECSQLEHISNEGTLIPQDSLDTLHEQWRAKRNQQLEKYHIQRIGQWQKIANRQFPFLDQLQEGENGKLALVNEWLARLEKTKDYTTAQQARIAEVAMALLQAACEDKEFFSLFIDQIGSSTECCEDRAAMSLNELYSSLKMYKGENFKEMAAALKTDALRKAIACKISKLSGQAESVEIYLYYELEMKKYYNENHPNEIAPLTLMEGMRYSTFGDRHFDLKELYEQIEASYLDAVLEYASFEKLLMKDEEFRTSIEENQPDLEKCEGEKAVQEAFNSFKKKKIELAKEFVKKQISSASNKNKSYK